MTIRAPKSSKASAIKPKAAPKAALVKKTAAVKKPKRYKSAYSPAEMEEIFRRFSIQRPEPKGELEHVNPFTLVVAVALSAQATDAGATRRPARSFR